MSWLLKSPVPWLYRDGHCLFWISNKKKDDKCTDKYRWRIHLSVLALKVVSLVEKVFFSESLVAFSNLKNENVPYVLEITVTPKGHIIVTHHFWSHRTHFRLEKSKVVEKWLVLWSGNQLLVRAHPGTTFSLLQCLEFLWFHSVAVSTPALHNCLTHNDLIGD